MIRGREEARGAGSGYSSSARVRHLVVVVVVVAVLALLGSYCTAEAFLQPQPQPQRRAPVPTTASIHRRSRLAAAASDAATGMVGSGSSPPPPLPTARDEDGFVLEGPLAEAKDRFVVDITVPEPTAEELAEENLVKIVKLACRDEEVNMLAWKCLGYRYVPSEGRWDNTHVFPKWRAKYPDPPDLVGVTRIYEKEVDAPVKKANTQLVRSVPKMYKQSLKELLAPYGFKGFKIAELTPNRTRRAQVCNWVLYYKRNLWGVPLEELMRRKDEVTQVTRDGETSEQLANKMVY